MDTEFSLSDSDIYTKILFFLLDTLEWTPARQFIYHEKQDLLTIITTIWRHEKPKLSIATINITTDSGRIRVRIAAEGAVVLVAVAMADTMVEDNGAIDTADIIEIKTLGRTTTKLRKTTLVIE